MAVRVGQYGREMDKNPKGKSLQANMKRAAAVSSTTRIPDKFAKPSMGDKAILAILRAKKKLVGGGKKKPLTTERSSQITSQLKRAGLSDSDIQKLKGKK